MVRFSRFFRAHFHGIHAATMKNDGPISRFRRVCGRLYPQFSSLFRVRPRPATLIRQSWRSEKDTTRGNHDNHVVKPVLWKPPPAAGEAPSAAVRLAAIELDIALVDNIVRKLFAVLLHGDEHDDDVPGGAILSTRSPHWRGFIHQQLEELAREKAKYKEERLALLATIEAGQSTKRSSLIQGTCAVLGTTCRPNTAVDRTIAHARFPADESHHSSTADSSRQGHISRCTCFSYVSTKKANTITAVMSPRTSPLYSLKL